MSNHPIVDRNKNSAGWRLPYYILLPVLIFAVVNSLTALNMRGIADKEGYMWNSAHYIPINTYEDDGRYNVYSALGYKGFYPRLEYQINIGGPYIHITRFAAGMANKLGIIKIFESPFTYYAYPREYLKIWIFLGLFKVWLFLLWFPIVIYWIGARHFSKVTGILAALLTVTIPFITGFEPRIKADSVAIILGLFSILWQLEYIKSQKERHLSLAAVFLGLSLSVKFNMLPAAITLFLAYIIVKRDEGANIFNYAAWKQFIKATIVAFLVFVIANPLFIPGFISWIKHLLQFMKNVSIAQQGHTDIKAIFESIWYRIIHFDSHFGPVLNWLVIPALAFASIRLIINKNHQRISNAVLLVALLGFIFYIAAVMKDAVIFLTYYYYTPAIIILILISSLLAAVWEKAIKIGRIASFIIGIIIIFIIGFTAYENSCVFNYTTSKTNRQEMYGWIEKNIPQGTSIGIPMAPISFFNAMIRLDPFKHRLIHIGEQAELLDKNQPDYFMWILSSPDSKVITNKDYKVIAEFNKGTDLPHERYDLYQEQVFQLYKRVNPPVDISNRSILGEMEYKLGEVMRADPEDEFRILQFRSISFMSGWLNLMRKENETLQYDSDISFENAIRADKLHYAKYAYIHQIGPTILQLWGVKYVLARLGEGSPFESAVLKSERYNFKEVQKYQTLFGEETRDILLCYNNDYIGQVFFAKYGKEKSQKKNKNENTRILYEVDEIKSIGTDNIAIYMKIDTSVPAGMEVRAGGNGEYNESWSMNKGKQIIWMPYRIFNRREPLRYEINPLEGDKGRIKVEQISVYPLFLSGEPLVSDVKISQKGGSAIIEADSEGDAIFSLPYHKYWKARIDGRPARVKKGLAGTIAVGVRPGRHHVEVYFK